MHHNRQIARHVTIANNIDLLAIVTLTCYRYININYESRAGYYFRYFQR
jgi:hypothetical protein